MRSGSGRQLGVIYRAESRVRPVWPRVSSTAGTTAPSLPAAPIWCQTAGCYTSPDGTITQWHNVGKKPGSQNQGNAIWPGPKGQGEARLYADNGHLTTWDHHTGTIGDGAGYVGQMMQYLSGLHASFPWTVSSHTGPPSNGNYAYADAEAMLAALNGTGFGMQSISVIDPPAYAAAAYPTSKNDWAANFQKYPNVPVHHLQLAAPGNAFWWSEYAVGASGIQVLTTSGVSTATVNCSTDCSAFSAQPIYITGNSNVNLNAVWSVACANGVGPKCAANTLQFVTPVDGSGYHAIPDGTYYGGDVWSENYWPIVLPFSLARGATSTELWECDLDFAFNTSTSPTGMGGCSTVGVTGGNPDYTNSILNTLAGQPTSTGTHGAKMTTRGTTHF
jgi:hypothetical protein